VAGAFRGHLVRQIIAQSDAHRTFLGRERGPYIELPFPAADPLTVFLSPFSVMAWLIILRMSGSRSLTVPRATLSQYHSAH